MRTLAEPRRPGKLGRRGSGNGVRARPLTGDLNVNGDRRAVDLDFGRFDAVERFETEVDAKGFALDVIGFRFGGDANFLGVGDEPDDDAVDVISVQLFAAVLDRADEFASEPFDYQLR
ncbi:MAG: hypothetical protein IJ387_11780, partial [Thermoguttaceae bacterium]|nr:hypothetical protein [Thermoguttaceae bacterium]